MSSIKSLKINLATTVISCMMLVLSSCKEKEMDLVVTHPDTPDFEEHVLAWDSLNLDVATATKQVPGVGEAKWTCNVASQKIENTNKYFIAFFTFSQYFRDSLDYLAPRELLSLYNVPLKVGDLSQSLTDIFAWDQDTSLISTSFDRFADDGDVSNGFWTLNHDKKNSLVITKVDTIQKVVSGRFDLFYVVSDSSTLETFSDTINFLDGKFSVHYKD